MSDIDFRAAKSIMGENFIGLEELQNTDLLMLSVPDNSFKIPFTKDELKEKKDDYLLILGCSTFQDGKPVTIRSLMAVFGKDPGRLEPCFYNQDWYEKESFIDTQMDDGWFLIRKSVFEESRAVEPADLMKKFSFPSVIRCTYAFFTAWLTVDIKLWYHDFVWCSDTDHNGDRIYVGKYHDIDGINKNGFSIHRHLGLRDCYGCI